MGEKKKQWIDEVTGSAGNISLAHSAVYKNRINAKKYQDELNNAIQERRAVYLGGITGWAPVDAKRYDDKGKPITERVTGRLNDTLYMNPPKVAPDAAPAAPATP
jgi:hypothetical protein